MLVFSEFGTVVRLDLPMDKKTGEHKGMAFVEFQAEAELRKALEDFATTTKYKMVVKPFKSRNSKESAAVNGKTSEEGEDYEEKRLSGGKPSKRNSHEPQSDSKRNSQEVIINEKRRSGDIKRSSKELKEAKEKEPERRRSAEIKENSRDKRYSKDAKEYARQQLGRPKDSKRTSKELIIGREVPQVPDSIYDNSFNQARARGARVQRNSDKLKMEEDEDKLVFRSVERPKFKKELDIDRPLFVPIRNPYGPTSEGRGFGQGRGKLILK